jgi:signal transduction histidine kinase
MVQDTQSNATDNRQSKQVLLVEDNSIERRQLAAKFRTFGRSEFDLTAVESLGEAIVSLEGTRFDVVILDLFLEDAWGMETLFRLRKASPEVPVVVFTGLNDEAQALQALRYGAQDYLIKGGVDWHVLFRAIRYAIERKQAENERRLIEQRLLEMQKLEAIGTLARGVAHNFNNALTVILGHCDLLQERTGENDNQRHIASIQTATNRAAVLTRQLLTFSRQQPAGTVAVNLNDIVSDMRVLLEAALPVEIMLELKLAPHAGILRINPGEIKQVLMNLVINARNAMPAGGTITIETRRNHNDQPLLTVSDTGTGMSQETCARVFEPFFTTKGLASAHGMGLSLVYGIVKQQGGTIAVASELGKGSTFSIAFSGDGDHTSNSAERHAQEQFVSLKY